MAKTITVNPSQVDKKAQELKRYNTSLKKKIQELKTQEKSLNSMWDGEANDEFHKRFNEDMTQMNNFYNAIENYVSKLNEIVDAYEKAEKKNLSTASKRTYK
ncbi:MAG: WXG100 family type VII secretion target [Lachnospiraceae bacterium]|nr:WXG100 family type VII secretion target [Lachnospiraceae bacterium]